VWSADDHAVSVATKGRKEDSMDIEFTDRYGGNPPAWIRGCHGDCDSMGFYPTQDQSEWPTDARQFGTPEEDGTPDDGWRFVKCRECNGTGRVSWLVSVARIPRWIWKGIRFAQQAMGKDQVPPEYTFADRLKLWLWCSYGADLQRLRRELFPSVAQRRG
jgi:hypothetical protein